jgi:DNA-binding transcriptional MerR regulator
MQENEPMSISKFANFTGMSRSALIFYDENGLFFPASRGENGYRYYAPMQIVTVNFVNTLRELDVPLKKIQELANKRTPEQLIELLIEQDDILSSEIERLIERRKIISTMYGNIQGGLNINENEISVRFMPSTRINLGDKNDFDGTFYKTYLDYCDYMKSKGQNLSFPIGGYTDSLEDNMKYPGEPTRFFSLDPDGKDKKPAGRYCIGYSRCYYGNPGDIVERIVAWAKEKGVELTEEIYQIFLFDEISLHEHNNYLMQTAVRVAEPPAQTRSGSRRATSTMRASRNS